MSRNCLPSSASARNSPGFTLVELMIVIALIGVLASLAVAAYQTYTVRAQVAEGLDFAGNLKTQVASAYTDAGIAPVNRVAAGLTPAATDSRGSYVAAIDIDRGRIDITFGGALAHQDIVGTVVSLTPYETESKSVVWRCGAASAPAGGILAGGAGHVLPSLNERYLPSNCRAN